MIIRKFFATAVLALATPLISIGALAQTTTPPTTPGSGDTQWQKDHPRREQVNQRLNNQNARINQEVKSGQISKAQGAQLHKNDRQIRKEERMMASQNGGHITKTEQKALNQQENRNSKKIGK
jgi:hypothetical protein